MFFIAVLDTREFRDTFWQVLEDFSSEELEAQLVAFKDKIDHSDLPSTPPFPGRYDDFLVRVRRDTDATSIMS